jgi:type IV secretory pathway TrbL component
MDITAKKITSYVLALLVVIVTAIALLAIWDVISLEYIVKKIMSSLLIIFAASVGTLFIFNVVIKDN